MADVYIENPCGASITGSRFGSYVTLTCGKCGFSYSFPVYESGESMGNNYIPFESALHIKEIFESHNDRRLSNG